MPFSAPLLRRLRTAGVMAVVGLSLVLGQTASAAQATPGKDGAGGTLTGVVNSYWAGTGSPAAGGTSLTVGGRAGAAQNITAGDLLLVIQMQGADIDSTQSGSYGDGVAGEPGAGALATNFQAGTYEYVVAATGTNIGAGGGTFTIEGTNGGGLENSYFTAGPGAQGRRSYQVVRVPQYTTATLSSGLTAEAWNGSTGGILALDVEFTLTLGGNVDVSALGFRGGGGVQKGTVSGNNFLEYRTLSTLNRNASKGEGTAGTPRYVYTPATSVVDLGVEGYPNGSFGVGAPGNAGGGGADRTSQNHNSGGGGGGNAGVGGRGGRAWNPNGPGSEMGGFGGDALPLVADRLFLGGGGGAGSRNNGTTPFASGGPGGGIVVIRTGSIAGTGTITLDGGRGVDSSNDAGGGGGSGGTLQLIVYDGGAASGLTVEASGGDGGDAWPTNGTSNINAAHGAGGGGGGGAVITNVTIGNVNNPGGADGTSLAIQLDTASDPGQTNNNDLGGPVVIDPNDPPGVTGGGDPSDLSTSTKTFVDLNGGNVEQADLLAFTITLIETDGVPATDVRVQDTLPAQLENLVVTSIPAGATDASVGDALDVTGVDVPANGAVAITFNARVVNPLGAGTSFVNSATLTDGTIVYTVDGPLITISAPADVAVGNKRLYLDNTTNGGATSAADALRRTVPAVSATTDYVLINSSGTGGGGLDGSATWSYAPGITDTLTYTLDGTSNGVLYARAAGGELNVDRELFVELLQNGTVVADQLIVQNLNAGDDASTNPPVAISLRFTQPGASTTPITGPFTVNAGEALELRISNQTPGDAGRRIRVYAETDDGGVTGTAPSYANRSRIALVASTVIDVLSVETFDAPWPATTTPPAAVFGPDDAIWLRAVVSDPFGFEDITGATLAVDDANGAAWLAATAMTEVAAASTAATKTFELQLTPQPSDTSPAGNWATLVTASEGTEGEVTDALAGAFELAFPDLLLLKNSTVFRDPVTGETQPKRIPGALVDYTITITNAGRGRPTPDSMLVTDNLPAGVRLATDAGGGEPFVVGVGNSDLTLTFPADVTFFTSDGLAASSTGGFYDNVTGFELDLQGTMRGDTGTASVFVVRYRTRIE